MEPERGRRRAGGRTQVWRRNGFGEGGTTLNTNKEGEPKAPSPAGGLSRLAGYSPSESCGSSLAGPWPQRPQTGGLGPSHTGTAGFLKRRWRAGCPLSLLSWEPSPLPGRMRWTTPEVLPIDPGPRSSRRRRYADARAPTSSGSPPFGPRRRRHRRHRAWRGPSPPLLRLRLSLNRGQNRKLRPLFVPPKPKRRDSGRPASTGRSSIVVACRSSILALVYTLASQLSFPSQCSS